MDKDLICNAKHTKYQPTDDEFHCPKCKAKSGDFYIIDTIEDANEECSNLHVGEYITCALCGYDTSAQSFATSWVKKHSLVPCKCCKGTGMVSKDKPHDPL
jgi:hypothetical protein